MDTIDQTRAGVTIGSTPLITDLDSDGLLDLVYSVKKDSLDPMGWGGIYVYRHELASVIPNSGIAWGSYLGTNYDGAYNPELITCGNGTVVSSFNKINPSCNGFSDGSITINVLGNPSSYTYLWSTQSTTSSIQNLAAGSYWVQVTDSIGCFELLTINIIDPFIISFGGIIPPLCTGDSMGTATLSSSGCPCMLSQCTFLWDNGVTTKPNYYLPEGWSSVIITHSNGCVVVDSVFVPSPAPVIDSLYFNDVELCFGDSSGFATVLYSQATLPITFSWSNGEINDTILDLTAGIYYVTAQDARGCNDSINFSIMQPDELFAHAVQVQPIQCFGFDDGIAFGSAFGGTSGYSFTWDNLLTGSSGQYLDSLNPGFTHYMSLMQNGCVASDTVLISEPAQLFQPIISCWEITTFDSTACVWLVTGTQDPPPLQINCWDLFVFDTITCIWQNLVINPLNLL